MIKARLDVTLRASGWSGSVGRAGRRRRKLSRRNSTKLQSRLPHTPSIFSTFSCFDTVVKISKSSGTVLKQRYIPHPPEDSQFSTAGRQAENGSNSKKQNTTIT